MKNDEWLTVKQASATLGVKKSTLYAYVSRGLVRKAVHKGPSRTSLYARIDIDSLVMQRARPRGRAAVATGVIDWGEPVLESAVSTVRDGELWFGDGLARDLAEVASLEQTAERHWRIEGLNFNSDVAGKIPKRPSAVDHASIDQTPIDRGLQFLAAEVATSLSSQGRTRSSLAAEGGGLLSRFTDAILGTRAPGLIHERLGNNWQCENRSADLLRRMLVLSSDHELNPSTFAVRVAASTGAPLAAATLAGLATLTGPRHGGAGLASLSFLKEAIGPSGLRLALAAQGGRSSYEFGFGHPLYPDGDARAKAILEHPAIQADCRRALTDTGRALSQSPNVDSALAAVTLSLGLPHAAPLSIFAIGRMSGWIAHAIEQIETGTSIRPRARFAAPK